MANFNRQADNRKAKLKRRRREVIRIVEKWKADESAAVARGEKPTDLERKIRVLRRTMRTQGGP